ncbi:hypothetical protein IVY21_22650 [Salmonella enterica subsp. enterica serovar Worthington]|nr:hypothetical protein [Salmonella enterica subsp. enterica serovar Worthington]
MKKTMTPFFIRGSISLSWLTGVPLVKNHKAIKEEPLAYGFPTASNKLGFELWEIFSFMGSLGLYRTDESTPALCLIPLSLNHDDICDSEEDDEHYEEKYPDIEITENDLWITSDQVRELLKYNGDYSDLPDSARRGISSNPDLMQEIKRLITLLSTTQLTEKSYLNLQYACYQNTQMSAGVNAKR